MTYAEWAATNPPSAIHGDGWGSDHLWHYESTPSNCSYYKCAHCFWPFGHSYNHMPDIFAALKASGVPDKCARKQMWPVRYEYASEETRAEFAAVRAAATLEAA